jgi:hypothetical protein
MWTLPMWTLLLLVAGVFAVVADELRCNLTDEKLERLKAQVVATEREKILWCTPRDNSTMEVPDGRGYSSLV